MHRNDNSNAANATIRRKMSQSPSMATFFGELSQGGRKGGMKGSFRKWANFQGMDRFGGMIFSVNCRAPRIFMIFSGRLGIPLNRSKLIFFVFLVPHFQDHSDNIHHRITSTQHQQLPFNNKSPPNRADFYSSNHTLHVYIENGKFI